MQLLPEKGLGIRPAADIEWLTGVFLADLFTTVAWIAQQRAQMHKVGLLKHKLDKGGRGDSGVDMRVARYSLVCAYGLPNTSILMPPGV